MVENTLILIVLRDGLIALWAIIRYADIQIITIQFIKANGGKMKLPFNYHRMKHYSYCWSNDKDVSYLFSGRWISKRLVEQFSKKSYWYSFWKF